MILRIEHLVKRFGGLVAVDDLELNVYKGKINALDWGRMDLVKQQH